MGTHGQTQSAGIQSLALDPAREVFLDSMWRGNVA